MMQGGHLPQSSRADWSCTARNPPPTGEKEHEGCAPSYSAAGENHLHHGKQVCRIFFLYHGAGALHLPRSNCASWACIARNLPPERSNPLNGENLIYQVRELRRNFPAVMRCARRLSKLRFSSLSGWNRRRGKEHEGCAPSYSAAGENPLHHGTQVCRIYKNSMVLVLCICRVPTAQVGRA